jgi:peroxiredoxin
MLRGRNTLAGVALLAAALPAIRAADLPRPAPELTIPLTGGKQVLLSQYKGKVVAVCFILTTCPHCQKTIGFLVKDQQEYGPRGFQVLASAIEEAARMNVPSFIKMFNTPFPVGYSNPQDAIGFMQHPPMLIPMMPLLAFVDRQGNIRAQHEGDDDAFFGANQEQNLRKEIESLLGNPARKRAGKK